jgi:hypothetical protein
LKYTDYFEQYSLIQDNGTPLCPEEYQEKPHAQYPSLRICPRKREADSRIDTARPGLGELFYLQALLMCQAAMSFEDLCTVDGHLYPTFSEAACALSLFQNQNEAIAAIEDAIADFKSPAQLRFLFAHLILEGGPAPEMWSNFLPSLIEDYINFEHLTEELAADKALLHISDLLEENGKTLEHFALPVPMK